MNELGSGAALLSQKAIAAFMDGLREAAIDKDNLAQKGDQMSFVDFVNLVNPRYEWYTHNTRMAAVLQEVADGKMKRLIINMPPRHGKSELVSRLFSAYYLYRHPHHWCGITSYAADLALTLSRASRANFQRAGGEVSVDASAVKHWETIQGGGLWAAGVGGPITGKGFHLGIIDDPLKNQEEAMSQLVRENQKDWYRTTFFTRREPDAAIVGVLTRWHEEDWGGFVIDEEWASGHPQNWHIISFDAIHRDQPIVLSLSGDKEGVDPAARILPASCTVEPDWRRAGEALCPERYDVKDLLQIKATLTSTQWSALYQQDPRPSEGTTFQRQWFTLAQEKPVGVLARVRFWDYAATKGAGDRTAGVLMSVTREGVFTVEDVVVGQWASGDRDNVIRQTAFLDGVGVQQWREQEPGSSGVDTARAFVNMLVGLTARVIPSSSSKEARADPMAAAAQNGRVQYLRGEWNRVWLDELTGFGAGAPHDDIVDASSGAFNRLSTFLQNFRKRKGRAMIPPTISQSNL